MFRLGFLCIFVCIEQIRVLVPLVSRLALWLQCIRGAAWPSGQLFFYGRRYLPPVPSVNKPLYTAGPVRKTIF